MINIYCYEVSKYEPKLYKIDSEGRRYYTRNEWSAICDIGKNFYDGVFTADKYLKVENAYISVVKMIMKCNNVDKVYLILRKYEKWMSVSDLRSFVAGEEYCGLYDDELFFDYNMLNDKVILNDRLLESEMRLTLRENIGGTIIAPRKVRIRVGYDYLVSVESHVNLQVIKKNIEQIGMYIQE